MRVGVCLPQFTDDAELVERAAVEVEELGYDAVSFFDHLVPLGGPPERPILECFTALTWIAARTSRVRVLPLVARAALRTPAMYAHLATTLHRLAGDRLVLAFGAGDKANEAEDASIGLPVLSQEERRDRLAAVVTAVRAAVPGVPVWVGGTSARTLELAGQVADGWNVWGVTPEQVRAGAHVVADAAAAAGRVAPVTTWAGQVVLAATADEATERHGAWAGGRGDVATVHGDPTAVLAGMRALGDAGVSDALLSFVGGGAADQRRLFAREVLPHL